MKTNNILAILAVGTLLAGSCGTAYAQSADEQGLTIPRNLQLPQDKAAVEQAYKGWWKDSRKNYDERMAWYKQAKFGCFIHWGVYSAAAGMWHGKQEHGYSEHLMRKARIPLKQYKEELVANFDPSEFDADQWMKYVRDAGMKYFVITAKHHDGFAMYHSDAYPYDIRLTKCKIDPMMALRKAAKKYGIKFGFYYSHAFDWEHPDAPGNDWDYPTNPGGDKQIGGKNWWLNRKDFLTHAERYVNEKSIPQIQELIKKYNPDILWFDTPSKLPLYLNIRILQGIREVDPENKIVVNGRLVRFSNRNMGDYRNTGDRAAFFPPTKGLWESIPTTNESYGYSAVDTLRKPSSFFICLLASAASKGGNILMNVGPMGNGAWDVRDVNVLKGIGKWMKINGESIYGTERTDLPIQQWGVVTVKGNTLYAHVFDWPKDGKLIIGGLRSDIKSARLLANGKTVKFKRLNDDDCQLNLTGACPDTVNTVVVIDLKNKVPAGKVRLLDTHHTNILYTFDSQLIGRGLGFGDGKVNRNYVKGWKNNTQSMKWTFRQSAPSEYTVYVDYNTAAKDDRGTIEVDIDGQRLKADYEPFLERRGTTSVCLGKIKIAAGNHTCELKGIEHTGKQYMNPIAVRLAK